MWCYKLTLDNGSSSDYVQWFALTLNKWLTYLAKWESKWINTGLKLNKNFSSKRVCTLSSGFCCLINNISLVRQSNLLNILPEPGNDQIISLEFCPFVCSYSVCKFSSSSELELAFAFWTICLLSFYSTTWNVNNLFLIMALRGCRNVESILPFYLLFKCSSYCY